MGRRGGSPPRHPWLRGAVRGTVGAMAMTGMRQASVGLGLIERTPPDEILRQGVPPLVEAFPENRRTAVIELAHWSYGASAGTVFALLPRRLRASRLAGPVYGVLAWGLFEVLLAPALGLGHARREASRERWALLADHVFFGLVVGAPPETSVADGGESAGDGLEDDGAGPAVTGTGHEEEKEET